jgi:hypothetical protein
LEDRRLLSVSFHGGALLRNVSVEPVYFGKDWNTAVYSQQAAQLNGFLKTLTGSPYMDMLNEYGVGRGSVVNDGIIDNGVSGGQTVDAVGIQQMLTNDIRQGLLAAPGPNRLYVVYPSPNVKITFNGGDSLNDFYGFHDAFVDPQGRTIYYAVIDHPVGNGDLFNLNDFQTLTVITSHEVVESATDPAALTNLDPGGWFGRFKGYDGDQEIADVALDQSHLGTLSGYTIQGVWSQAQNKVVLPADSGPGTDLPGGAPASPMLAEVANAFTHSTEYFSNLIQADYKQYLGRSATTEEVSAWVADFQHGLTDEQARSGFIGSPEFYAHAGGTNQAWVDALYHNLLGRAPDQAGETSWLQALAGGTSRAAVALGFATSAEAEGDVIRADYQHYLGRTATEAEEAAWVRAFASGTTNEQVVAGFVGSVEYYNSAKKGQGTDTNWIKSAYVDILNRQATTDEVNLWYGVLNR